MIAYPNKEQTLALAGIFQAANLVYQLAKSNGFDHNALHESSYSVIRLEAERVEEIYGSVYGLDLGLRTVIKQFSQKPDQSTRDIYQYVVGVHQLGTKLHSLHKTSDRIQSELTAIQIEFADSYEDDNKDDTLFEALADLYSTTISYISPRIIVNGVSNRLQDPITVNRVRSALFSGVRSAYLWHQIGGRRWHLLFNRKGYVEIARNILNLADGV